MFCKDLVSGSKIFKDRSEGYRAFPGTRLFFYKSFFNISIFPKCLFPHMRLYLSFSSESRVKTNGFVGVIDMSTSPEHH